MNASSHFLTKTLNISGRESDPQAEAKKPQPISDTMQRDDPYADCPPWAKEELPQPFRAFQGIRGLDPELRKDFEILLNGAPNASGVAGVDLYQANHFLSFRTETAAYIYGDYTPVCVEWPEDYLPALRQTALQSVKGVGSNEEKVRALLENISRRLLHPHIPPTGDLIAGNRNLDEDKLLLSGSAWCNEQARVLVRACQAVDIPARLIHFFYAHVPNGHTVMEFFDGTGWCLVDATYFLIFPGTDGHLMSAATCHDRGEGQRRCQESYREAYRKSVAIGEKMLSQQPDHRVKNWLKSSRGDLEEREKQLHSFAVMNYPLPPSGVASENAITSSL